MRDYFEEMNIDYDELKRYEDIETYYGEVQDYTKLIKELQCDRVEALKQIVNKNKEIERLNNIINKLNYEIKELDNMFYETFRVSQNGYYSISEWELKEFTDKIKELKGSDKK